MTKTKITIGIISSIMAFSATANQSIPFSDRHGVYSAVELGYGTEGMDVGVQLGLDSVIGKGVVIGYDATEDLDVHHVYGEIISPNGGVGYRANYEYGRHHLAEGSRSQEFSVGAFKRYSAGENWSITPDVGLGVLSHSDSTNESVFTQLSAEFALEATDNLWFSLTPTYSYSFNDMKNNDGSKGKLRDMDYDATIGYRFADRHSLQYTYTYSENGDNQSLVNYRVGF